MRPPVTEIGNAAGRLTNDTELMDLTVADRDDVRRVLIAGDTHGNSEWVAHLTGVAAGAGCPVIIQVGDRRFRVCAHNSLGRSGARRVVRDSDPLEATDGVVRQRIDVAGRGPSPARGSRRANRSMVGVLT